MQIYLINLDRRPDRLATMTERARALDLKLERVGAIDAATVEPKALDRWFEEDGPLGEVPRGDKACLLSHRLAWERFLAGGQSHAAFLEDDVLLSAPAKALLADDAWIPGDAPVVKLEHYGPKGQRVLLDGFRPVMEGFRIGRMLSRHTGAAAYILSRRAAEFLSAQRRFALPVDHLLFNPNNSALFADLNPVQLLPAIARQEQFVGLRAAAGASDIEGTRVGLRAIDATYVKRELTRFAYDLRLVPRQLGALAGGAKLTAVETAK
jgi:glycosyl transferase family 25